MKTIQVKVKPNARASRLVEQGDGTWLAQVKSRPVDGRANEELLLLVSQYYNRRKAQISIKSGASGRTKLVQIED
ncbi:MAG: DUF167 domain-containing protein [Gemmatimonadota bacterium]|nr:DUF167 domain-containing protein [Gemmatimonadota bacterium]